ncbi:aquaporin-like protein [Hyaloscypha finlandica]|nr:aquaporin-like protein [Hyaloscypha finlandica]
MPIILPVNINASSNKPGFVLSFFHKDTKRRSTGTIPTASKRLDLQSIASTPFRGHQCRVRRNDSLPLFAFSGTQVALLATPATVIHCFIFGFSLAVDAWVFFRISVDFFNLTVTLGMCLIGALPYVRGTAAAICPTLFAGFLTLCTNLGSSTPAIQGLFLEIFLSAELLFTIFMLAAEKHESTFITPVGIGLSLLIPELTGVYFTGGSVNLARSLGPSAMLEYETANPNQDVSRAEGDDFNPDDHASNTHISFAPEDSTDADVNMEKGILYGTLREYGTGRRPYSESPELPHPNDQFAGLAEGGMHADQIVKPAYSLGSGSERTLASPVGNQVP